MPQVTLSNEQKAQLIGWLNREKDYLLSIDSMALRIIIPRATGTSDFIKNDLDFAIRLRSTLRGQDPTTELSVQDAETLVDVARANDYSNRAEFWKSIVSAVESGQNSPTLFDAIVDDFERPTE